MSEKYYLMRPTVHQTSDLSPKLKEPLRGRRFSSVEELSTDSTRATRHINKSGVLDGVIILPKRCESVIEKQGDYIE